jgi:sugar O-acyltransferase (sialic acid O-acetyltransferase NeuD family)
MNSVVIVGAGGFGRIVLDILKDQNKVTNTWNILGFIDENSELKGKLINNYPVLGGLEWLKERKNHKIGCVCAIGTSKTRKDVVQRLEQIGVNFVNVIHPSANISDSVKMGHDVVVCGGAHLTPNTIVGNHVHVNVNSAAGHDVVLGDYCTISALVNINGYDRLDEGVFVGGGAVFIPEVSVGKWATIGAGAAVTKNIEAGVTAVGVPAKPIKKN